MKNRRFRGALIGCGFIGSRGHLPGYLERLVRKGDLEIVAVADVSPARRQAALELVPNAALFDNHEALLDSRLARDLDFVDICTPPAQHAPIAHAALDRGLHVLCEKPLTTTIEEARALLDHARVARRVLFPCHNYRHAPVVKEVRSIIDSGRIGKVTGLVMNTMRNTHAKGVAEWRPDWRREQVHSGGGIAMDHGSHTFYLAFDWLRSYPTAVTAKMHTIGPWDTEDNFSCSLTFPHGVATAHLSWTAGMRKVLYVVSGEAGGITVNDDVVEVTTIEARSGAPKLTTERHEIPSHWMDASHVTWFGSLLDRFVAAIDADEFVGRDAQEAFLCVQLIQTAYASSRAGSREVPLTGLSAVDPLSGPSTALPWAAIGSGGAAARLR